MADVWICNASPLIVLAKAGHLDFLIALSGEILLPAAGVDEVLAGPVNDPARQALESGWGNRRIPKSVTPELLSWRLGPGETSVVALAVEYAPAVAVLDDAAARTHAKSIGVQVIGSLGVIIRAKRFGLLESASESLKTLRSSGLYFDDETARRILAHVDETWT